MSIAQTNRVWLISVAVIFIAVLGVFALKTYWSNDSDSGVESRLIENGRLSVNGRQTVIDVTKASELDRLRAFLDKNTGLVKYLNTELQGLQLQRKWDQSKATYFSRVSSSLRYLLECGERSMVTQALLVSTDGERPLDTYLDDFIKTQKSIGNGYVSGLSEADQRAVGDALKLQASLKDRRDLKQELIEIASWYTTEKGGPPGSETFQEILLQHAWELSSADLEIDPSNLGEDVTVGLKKETDLTRLLNHQSEAVVKNAANLISIFAPENAITALRFQLLRSNNNQERFLLLDAIKSYGEQRSQVEPQLKKMLRLTRDTNLHEKIMETIDHLNGRSNKLFSKSD